MIQYRCTGCQATIVAAADRQEAVGRCAECGASLRFSLPHASPQSGETSSDDSLRAALDEAFSGSWTPPQPRVAYLPGLCGVALVMIALPLVYIGLMGLIGYGAYFHLANQTDLLSRAGGLDAVVGYLLYVTPPLAAGVVLLLMLKPLLARAAGEARLPTLTKENNPQLFALVERICQQVDAPFPQRIEVDDQPNATARLVCGWQSLLRGDQFVLTIGIPLIKGLTTQQFAGVLAHELGHFRQRAGMRLTGIVRSVSDWFARVAYAPDEWDIWLAKTATSVDLKSSVFLYLVMLLAWLLRGVLWYLMGVGHIAASLLLRQMEYDADQYQVHVVGIAAFRQTIRQMRLVGAAYALSLDMLSGLLQQGVMVDDIAAFANVQLQSLPEEFQQDVCRGIQAESTGAFDTHPCDRDRIAAAEKTSASGLFRHQGPAADLFGDLDQMSRESTWDRYRRLTGNHVTPDDLMPYRQLIDAFQLDIFGEHSKENMKKEEALALQHHLANPDRIPFDN